MSEKQYWRGGIIFYVVIGFLQFGHVINTVPCQTIKLSESYSYKDCHDRDGASVVSGILWPIVYVGKLAIWITRP